MQLGNIIKVFIASPGDCNDERKVIRSLVSNDPTIKTVCEATNCRVDVKGWEDIYSDVGRPQTIINNEIRKYNPDIIIFIFWSRLGSDAGSGWTGTEEEWNLALKMNEQGDGKPRVSLFLNKEDIPFLEYDQKQVDKLNHFVNKVFSDHKALAKMYNGSTEFEKLIRSYIVNHLLNYAGISLGYSQYKNKLLLSSEELLKWPSCLKNGNYIVRNEMIQIEQTIKHNVNSTQLVLGPKGTGKSSLLSVFGKNLIDEGLVVLGIKSDTLPTNIDSIQKLSFDYLNLDINLIELLRMIALDQKVIIIIDQLDALSELTDQKTNRLNTLLNLIRTLSDVPNVHIVASSRDFEYRHDSRLSNINADPIYLELPIWGEIEPIIQELGFNTEIFTELTKELLRTPLHLNLFINVAQLGDVYDSLHALLQGLWDKEVENRDSWKKVELLEQVAHYMSEEEVFWVPLSMFDGNGRTKDALLSSEILVVSENGRTIGFRHQTYLDFVLTKTFARKGQRLSKYILNNQDTLFIRGTVINTLNYLRTSAQKTYTEELISLFKDRPRKHLWILLIEFIGSQDEPLPVEKDLLEQVMVTDAEGPIVLRAISNSTLFVNFFLVRKSFRDWLNKEPESAKYTLPVLSKAAQSGNIHLTNLIVTTWLEDIPKYGHLLWIIMSDFQVWDQNSLLIVEKLAITTDSYYVNYVLESISQNGKKQAIKIYYKVLKRKFGDALNSLSASEKERLPVNSISSSFRKPFEDLLTEGIFSSFDIVSIADEEPGHFLEELWNLFIRILHYAAYEHHEWLEEYRHDTLDKDLFDEKEYYKQSFGEGVLTAINSLASNNPKKFIEFVSQNEKEDFQAVHQFLAVGLLELEDHYSNFIFEYLLKDTRRLNLENSRKGHYFSKKLIDKIYPHLNISDRQLLEDYLCRYNRYKKSMPDWNVSDKRNRIYWNRQHRLYLLRALPTNLISEPLKKIIGEEERALGFPEENDGMVFGGFIGARISLEEMKRAKNEDIIHLFNKITDKIDERMSKRLSEKNFARSGGASELGNVFKEFSKEHSGRSISLLKQLSPNYHQIYAGSGVQGLSESELSNEQLLALLNELIEKGFDNTEFILRAASGLDNRAGRNNGLSDEFVKILERWFESLDESQNDNYKVTSKDDRNGSLFFDGGGGYVLPGGRGNILRAIATCYLARKRPAISKYLSFLTRLLRKSNNSLVLSTAISFIRYCLKNKQAEKAINLFQQIIMINPEVFLYEEALYSIAPILRIKDQSLIQQECLYAIKNLEHPITNQAFGELLLACFYYHKDEWTRTELESVIIENDPKVLLGLTYAASELWGHFNENFILIKIFSQSLKIDNEPAHRAIGSIFYELNESEMDGQLEALMIKISGHPLVLERVAEPLLTYVAKIVNDYPDLAYLISKHLLDSTGEKVTDVSNSLAVVADDLISISISLQRNMLHRKNGIELFEILLSLNVREAKEALEVLERLPVKTSNSTSPRPPRRRRRKKSFK